MTVSKVFNTGVCVWGGGEGGGSGAGGKAVFARDKAAFVSFYPWKQVRALKALARGIVFSNRDY